MRVKAAITEGDRNFAIDTFNLAEPQAGEVLVKIKASGVCHTDYDSLGWRKRVVLGH